jgi:hypothetical protein
MSEYGQELHRWKVYFSHLHWISACNTQAQATIIFLYGDESAS